MPSPRTTHGVCWRSTTYADVVVPTHARARQPPPARGQPPRLRYDWQYRRCDYSSSSTNTPAARRAHAVRAVARERGCQAHKRRRRHPHALRLDEEAHSVGELARRIPSRGRQAPTQQPQATGVAPHSCGANASSTCVLNLEPSAAATHPHGGALAKSPLRTHGHTGRERSTANPHTTGNTPRATQRGHRQGVACDRPALGGGAGCGRASRCPRRMRSTAPTAAAAGGASGSGHCQGGPREPPGTRWLRQRCCRLVTAGAGTAAATRRRTGPAPPQPEARAAGARRAARSPHAAGGDEAPHAANSKVVSTPVMGT